YLSTLSVAVGAKTSLATAEELFRDSYGVIPFDHQASYLLDSSSPVYYGRVLGAEIQSAKQQGVMPKGGNVTPDDVVIAKSLYLIMVGLKKQYEQLRASGATFDPSLAAQAAKQYSQYNYLDAYRLLKGAQK